MKTTTPTNVASKIHLGRIAINAMNPKNIVISVLSLALVGIAGSALGQTTVYEQSRFGSTTSGSTNPDFTFAGFISTLSANKSTAPGLPGGSSSSRIASTSIAAGPGTNFIVSPNFTTAGQLVNGTTYAVAITFGSTGGNETTDLVVTTSDTETSGNDTFAGTSSCFQRANGYNVWIPVGIVTINGALPTFTFTYLSGAGARWYVDSIQFTPLPPGPSTEQYWDTGSGIGGTGNWDTTTANWNSNSGGSGTQQSYLQAALADFAGAPGTVSIDPVNGIITDGGLEFDVNGYVLEGGTLTLGSGPTFGTNIAVVGTGNAVTINSVISGSNGFCNAGLGTVNLGAAMNLAGTVTLNAGKLHFQPGVSQTFTSLGGGPGALALGANTLTVGDSTSTTYIGVISDGGSANPGALIKQGSGTLTLGGANTFAGTTTINQGVLSIAADSGLGGAPSSLVPNQLTLNGNGATLFASATMTFNANRGITLNGSNVITAAQTREVTFNNPITGSGSLTFESGWPDFNEANTFTGNLIFAGTNNISARFNANNSAGQGKIYVSPLTNAGTPFTMRNYLTNDISTLANNIEFNLGGQNYNIDTGPGSSVFTLSGNIDGAAPVAIGDNSNGQGEVVLSGNNSAYSGGFMLEGGTLTLGNQNALGAGTFTVQASSTPNSAYMLQAALPLTGSTAITNAVVLNVSSGFIIQGANAMEFSGPIELSNYISLENDNSGGTIFSGTIGDGGNGWGLTVTGAGILTLSGANTYSGGTTINSTELLANSTTGSGTGSGPVYVNSGAFGGTGSIAGNIIYEDGTLAEFTVGSPMTISGSLSLYGNTVVHLQLPPNITTGTYTLATYNPSGSYGSFASTPVIDSGSLGNGGSATITTSNGVVSLTATISGPPSFNSVTQSGSNVVLAGTGGTAGATYYIVTSTNVALPLASWTPVATNTYGSNGGFTNMLPINPAQPDEFFMVVTPP